MTVDLKSLAVWAHFILIWSPFLLHGPPLDIDLGPQLAPRALRPMVSKVVPLALYLGAPLALEAPKALDLECFLAPCSIGF